MIKYFKRLQRFQETLLHMLLALVIASSVMTFPLDFLEAPLYDLRQILSMKPAIDERIAIITIDDQTLNQLNFISPNPLPLDFHVKAVQELEAQEVKSVAYLIDFNKVQRIDESHFDEKTAEEFYRATVRLNAHGVPFMLGIPFGLNGEENPPFPLNKIPQAVSRVTRDGVIFGKDNVTRRALVTLYQQPVIELALANKTFPNDTIPDPPGTYFSRDADAQYFNFRLHQANGIVYDENYETFPYPRYSFVDLVEGKIPPGTLKDKIVLVGSLQSDNPNEFTLINSLNSSDAGLIPKILIQANILDSILNEQGIRSVPKPILVSFCFLLSFMIILASFKIRPSRLIGFTVFLIVGTFGIAILLFQPIPIVGNYWLPLSTPLLSLTLSFYLMIPLRLYSEHRKRYELEKQNTVLRQVEEMKTNFLQLVTHDLKTPVAKIQGLTESLKRSLHDNLKAKDLEVMNHILSANDELNHFINSLLELTRLDNQGLRVHLQTKDLNHLLESIILKHRYATQAKQIQVVTQFETLFPFKFDPELILKVLSNLLDNAIKYSPEGTTITLETREVGDRVEISIQDQGIGIPEEERQNLFSRFYRIKNDTTQKVKGTGLGLYLSKYFIESHHGSIEVLSVPQEGTCFKISLPLDLKETDVTNLGLTTHENLKKSQIKEKNYA